MCLFLSVKSRLIKQTATQAVYGHMLEPCAVHMRFLLLPANGYILVKPRYYIYRIVIVGYILLF